MYLAYLGQKHFSIPKTAADLVQGVPVKHFQGLFAYFNFTFDDYEIDISIDDREFSEYFNDVFKYGQIQDE